MLVTLMLLVATLGIVSQGQADTAVARGQYLVEVLGACGNCHTPRAAQGENRALHLGGGFRIAEAFGVAIVPNITPDQETGLGTWTDEEIIRAIREGKGKDGRTLGPPMPYDMYRRISDTDVKAIVAYLRTVPAVRHAVPRSQYTIPLPESYGPPVTSVLDPPQDDPIKYGEYLTGPIAHCRTCHTPVTPDGRPDLTRLYAGSRAFHGPYGTSYGANLTPDRDTGIGSWTDAQVMRAIYGVRPDGRTLLPPMPWGYFAGNIAAADLKAILAYLRSLQPLVHKVPPPEPPRQ